MSESATKLVRLMPLSEFERLNGQAQADLFNLFPKTSIDNNNFLCAVVADAE